ncbi:Vacuolar sorting protein 18 [Camellia lanceoleosa]|uniref:Vacuolar sorting protein 18 n=1 Tax=Camellia lanceoleosa TaxID=1840588 RepID=A0ACC0FYL5_9ERIC|nr:Vacuolar sorting protein 18 [Camellia lanceoleosa]
MDYPWEAICSSLEDYNKQIEQLKQEMNDATHGADNSRDDISVLAQQYVVIDYDEDCGICSQLDDAIASECPFCGDLMIREISLPFILPGEAYEATS